MQACVVTVFAFFAAFPIWLLFYLPCHLFISRSSVLWEPRLCTSGAQAMHLFRGGRRRGSILGGTDRLYLRKKFKQRALDSDSSDIGSLCRRLHLSSWLDDYKALSICNRICRRTRTGYMKKRMGIGKLALLAVSVSALGACEHEEAVTPAPTTTTTVTRSTVVTPVPAPNTTTVVTPPPQ
jgi:hypothetical protein